MHAERGKKTRVWAVTTAVACILAFITLAQGTWAQEPEDPYCSWTKEVWINGVGPETVITPRYFGVVVSDTVHIRDTLFCDFAYDWSLHEYWDPDLLSFQDPDYVNDAGEVDEFPAGSLAWWGSESSGQPVQLDKYLHVDMVGWVTTEISETVEFSEHEGPTFQFMERPFYLQELVEGGDAPSSYNHTSAPMTTTTFITGTLANFPVVWDWDGTMGPAPPSYGFCHYYSLAPSFLGITVTHELDADLLPDDDVVTNIDPSSDTPDQDLADDGVTFPSVVPHCGTATVKVVGENNHGSNLYLNAWADWNRDGDWDDTSVCECKISEWIIQGYSVGDGAFGLDIDISSCHPVPDPTEPLWVRVTLSEEPLSGEPWSYGGQLYPASTECFEQGETEDYYVPQLIPECEWDKHVYVNDELAGEWDEGPFAVMIDDMVAINDELVCNFDYEWSLLEEWDPGLLSFVAEDHISGTVELDPLLSPDSLRWYGGDPVRVPARTSVTVSKTLSVDEGFSGQSVISETVQFDPYGPMTWQRPVVLESHMCRIPLVLKEF